MTIRIPCDTIARLSVLLPDEPTNDPFDCFRLEAGKVLAVARSEGKRSFMAVEQVDPFDGTWYVRPDAALIAQCRTEAAYSSTITFNPVQAAGWTTGTTTMGWKSTDNLGLFPTEPTDFDKWPQIVASCAESLDQSHGPIVTSADGLARLASSSPSGLIAWELHSNPQQRPTVVRDVDSHDWCGFFLGRLGDGRAHNAAVVPGGLK